MTTPQHGIAVQIVQGKEPLFVTTRPKKVITQGNPSTNVDVLLAPAGPAAPSGG